MEEYVMQEIVDKSIENSTSKFVLEQQAQIHYQLYITSSSNNSKRSVCESENVTQEKVYKSIY